MIQRQTPYYFKESQYEIKRKQGRAPLDVSKMELDFTFLTDDEYLKIYAKLKSFSWLNYNQIDEDVISETFIKAYRYADKYNAELSSKYTWITNIFKSEMNWKFRKNKTKQISLNNKIYADSELTYKDTIKSIDDEYIDDDFEYILRLITNDERFHMLRLRAIDKLSYIKISQREGIALSAVKTLIFQERKKLRLQMEKYNRFKN